MNPNEGLPFQPVSFVLTEILKSDSPPRDGKQLPADPDKSTNESEDSSTVWYHPGLSTATTKGLHNLGNTCYLNSVLQVLMNTPVFLDTLQRESQSAQPRHACDPVGPNRVCLTCETLKLSSALRQRSLAPSAIVSNVRHLSKRFSGNRQQDSHEFLLLLLNKIDRRLSCRFAGSLDSVVRCRRNHVSTTPEAFFNLTLDIRRVGSLQNALKAFFAESSPIRGYKCEGCKGSAEVTRQYQWRAMPDYLVLHLGRFDRFANKIGNHLDFDLRLRANDCQYVLYGAVEHLGSSLDFGHYVAFAMNADRIWFKVSSADERRGGLRGQHRRAAAVQAVPALLLQGGQGQGREAVAGDGWPGGPGGAGQRRGRTGGALCAGRQRRG